MQRWGQNIREVCVGGVKKSKGHVIAAKPHMAQHTGRKRSNWQKVCWWKYYGSGKMKKIYQAKKAWAKNNKQADVLPSCWPCCESTAACPRTTLQYHNFVHFAQALFVYLVFVFVFLIDAAPLTTTIQRQWVQSQSLYCYALATCSNAISHFELRVHAM